MVSISAHVCLLFGMLSEMLTVEEATHEYIQHAWAFERRLLASLDIEREVQFSIEPKVKFLKVLIRRIGWDSGVYARVNRSSGDITEFFHNIRHGLTWGCVGNVFTGNYGLPDDVPEPNTDVCALWREWYSSFNREPLGLSKSFTDLLGQNEIDGILEAIRITRLRREIVGNEACIKYVRGILHHRHLEKVAPERAAEMKVFFSLQQYWKHQPRGSGYLNRQEVLEWLRYCTADEIRCIMRTAEGIWADLRDEMDRLVATRKAGNEALNEQQGAVQS
jgi:hypothetical protein